MSWRRTLIVSATALASALAASPLSSAEPSDYQYVETKSGAVQCIISVSHVSCDGPAPGGFPDAPPNESGSGKMNIAKVEADGSFNWGSANMGYPDGGPVTLEYDQPYNFKGWSVAPSFNGTRFTNDATGHGMFVSIDGVDPF